MPAPRHFGVECNRRFQFALGIRVLARLQAQEAKLIVGGSERGFDLDGLLQNLALLRNVAQTATVLVLAGARLGACGGGLGICAGSSASMDNRRVHGSLRLVTAGTSARLLDECGGSAPDDVMQPAIQAAV